MNQGANLHFPAAVGRESASLQSDSRKPRFTNPKSEQTYNTWHRPLQGHKEWNDGRSRDDKQKTARETVIIKGGIFEAGLGEIINFFDGFWIF